MKTEEEFKQMTEEEFKQMTEEQTKQQCINATQRLLGEIKKLISLAEDDLKKSNDGVQKAICTFSLQLAEFISENENIKADMNPFVRLEDNE